MMHSAKDGILPGMRKEESLPTSWKRPFVGSKMRTHHEARVELQRSCGRFNSVRPTEEILRSFIVQKAIDMDILPEPLMISDGTPLNWRRLLSFLHEHQVIEEPRFSHRPYRNDYPQLIHYLGLSPKLNTDLSDGHDVLYGGFGGSFDSEEAMSKSIGETLERYFLSTYKREAFHAASYAELSRYAQALDVRQLDYFLDWQTKRFPEFAFNEHSIFNWVEGYKIGNNERTYLPAQLVYWNYIHRLKDSAPEKVIFHQTTSGSAGHFTKEEATLAALLESVQRDGFLIYWLNSLSPKVIDVSSARSAPLATLLKELQKYGLEPVFLNTTSDLPIPTVTCVIFDNANPEKPLLGIGSSSGFTIEETLLSSTIESLVVVHSLTFLEHYPLAENYEPFTSKKISRLERLRAWQSPSMRERFQFFLAGEKQGVDEFIGNANTLQSPGERLQYIINHFASLGEGYDIYAYDVHNTVLKQLGYHVVRTIVPALVPLYLIEFAAPLNIRRLREAPSRMGYAPAKKFNPWPHPFP